MKIKPKDHNQTFTIPSSLSKRRRAIKWTQAEFAKMMNMSAEAWGKIERGKEAPTYEQFIDACCLLWGFKTWLKIQDGGKS